jgi:tRNA A-37 threonylcarbamoyl transferase component Bud32
MDRKNGSTVLIARIAVREKMTDQSTVDRVLELRRSRNSTMSLGELLVQLGHITPEQFKRLQSLHRTSPDSREEEKLFGETVVSRGLASREQVGACLKEQAELEAKGIFKNLGEILVERKILTADQVKGLLGEQDRAIAFCPKCGEKYNVSLPWRGGVKCPADGTALVSADRDAAVGVAATLEPGGPPAGSPIGMEVGGCRIVELIARGAMGAVYKAKHEGLSRYVAVKLLPSVSKDPELVRRLLFEARAVAKVEHPNIVQVYDVGFQKGYFFIVMQLLRGQTLEERMGGAGTMDLPTALEIAKEVALGLGAAHARGVIHRDIKPANIMISEDGRARLTDFGLAQDVEDPEDQQGLIVGTPFYMSPEQWLGHRADERSDLYSLGVILYQMTTGHRPFESESVADLMNQHLKSAPRSPKEFDGGLPDGFCALVKKMLAKPPAKRYPNVPAFLADLEKVMQGEDPDALQEFGAVVRCGFCETFNPVSEKRCKVCGEYLRGAGGPLEIALREDEFKCPGCGGANRKDARSCAKCRKPFCLRCHRRLAVLRGYCERCMTHARRR